MPLDPDALFDDSKWYLAPAFRPRFAVAQRSQRSSSKRGEKYHVYYFDPERDIVTGWADEDNIRVGYFRLNETTGPDWPYGPDQLVLRWDDDGRLDGLYYPYRTRYDHPAFGLLELDPTVPSWVRLPAATYTVEKRHRVARLWRWDAIDAAHCPPTGAGQVMTRQQPNGTRVPIRYVPTAALSAEEGAALVPPEADTGETVGLSSLRVDEAVGERTRSLRATAPERYAADIRSSDGGPADGADGITVHYDPETVTFETVERVVVADVGPSAVTVGPVTVASPPERGDLEHLLDPEPPSAAAAAEMYRRPLGFDVCHDQEDPLVDVVYAPEEYHNGESIPTEAGKTATFHDSIDPEGFRCGDVLWVQSTHGPAPAGKHADHLATCSNGAAGGTEADLETTAFSLDPVTTALYRHMLPDFRHDGEHPEVTLTELPARFQCQFEPFHDAHYGDSTVQIEPLDGQCVRKRHSLFLCQSPEIPTTNGFLDVLYERPSVSLDDRRRVTSAWSDPDPHPTQWAILQCLGETDGWCSHEHLCEQVGASTLWASTEGLAARGLVEKRSPEGVRFEARLTAAGRRTLADRQ